ncbi:MAG: 2-hydroxychromene-2-carboxylate isomerase [Alphaproteobacteria bacterium]|nr:2-hydroxychromene-2-carboxylate isomerase [Alphaproteobacteria bacterium]
MPFDFYYSFRSPYSYLAISLIEREMQTWALRPRMRIVLPIAVRIPGFFKSVNPMWPPYLMRDTWRISEFNQIPYAWPKPDPIVMDISTGEVPAEQPYIYRVSRLGVLAEEAGKGVEFVAEAARAIWSGKIQNWHEGGHLERALEQAGLPLSLDQRAEEEAARLDAVIAENEAAQKAAGHWGVPLFVFNDEPFFGQDRIELLIWRMRQAGLQPA